MKKIYLYLALAVLILFNVNVVKGAPKVENISENRIIIQLNKKYDVNINKKIEDVLQVKITKLRKLNVAKLNTYVIYTKSNITNYKNKLPKITKIKEVQTIYPSYIYKLDPKSKKISTRVVGNSWHVNQTKADELKNTLEVKSKVKVGVIDSGIDYDHPALKNNIDKNLSYNFVGKNNDASDDIGHGTHVAGLIAADNEFSVGKNTEVVALRVLNGGFGSSEDIAEAINYAQKNNIKVINLSLGSPFYDDLMYEALYKYEGLAIVAAGNDNYLSASYPAAFELDNIISVGALEKNGNKASFSNYSKTNVDIFAPGQDIFSTCSVNLYYCYDGSTAQDQHDEDNIVSKMSGTSMSSPIVAGIVASLYSQDQNISMNQLKNSIIDGATKTNSLQNYATTEGYLDAKSSLEYTKSNKTNATHQAKINSDGSISLWGNNENGQLGNGNNNNLVEANPFIYQITNDKIVKYYLTKNNTFLVSEKGELYVTGANDFNQLNQYNTNATNSFVKFNKVNKTDEIVDIIFRDINGLYDENSMEVELKNKSYYKLGKDTYSINSNNLINSKGLKYIELNNGLISKEVLYKPYSNKIDQSFQMYYFIDNEDGEIKYYSQGEKYLKYNNDYYYEMKYDYYEGKKTETNRNYKNVVLNQTISYIEDNFYFDYLNDEFKNNESYLEKTYVSFKNGKKIKTVTDRYNYLGQLKSNSNNNSYRLTTNYYSNGKVLSKYKTIYNINGKLGKNYLTYKALYYTNSTQTTNNYYNSKMQKTKYTLAIKNKKNKYTKYISINYHNNIKYSSFNRSFVNGVRSKDLIYKYNNKGALKTSGKSKAYQYIKTYKKGKLISNYRYTYNNKGKKINKIVIYLKGGK